MKFFSYGLGGPVPTPGSGQSEEQCGVIQHISVPFSAEDPEKALNKFHQWLSDQIPPTTFKSQTLAQAWGRIGAFVGSGQGRQAIFEAGIQDQPDAQDNSSGESHRFTCVHTPWMSAICPLCIRDRNRALKKLNIRVEFIESATYSIVRDAARSDLPPMPAKMLNRGDKMHHVRLTSDAGVEFHEMYRLFFKHRFKAGPGTKAVRCGVETTLDDRLIRYAFCKDTSGRTIKGVSAYCPSIESYEEKVHQIDLVFGCHEVYSLLCDVNGLG